MLLKQLIQIQEAAQPVKVAEAYQESSDFDSDMSEVDAALKKAAKILSSKSWLQHMKDTDDNYSTSGAAQSREILTQVKQVVTKLDKLYNDFIDAA
jgi:hypothetical protein